MDDLIFRSAAIDAIQNAYCDTECGKDWCAVWKNKGMYEALLVIQDVPSTQRWIPVTEKLPVKRTWVLCKCRANIYEVLSWRDGVWYHDPQHRYLGSFVTHWRELPEPPKEEET